jgi:hypothetical protein
MRQRRDGRPVRVLYCSDFDPAGLSMPVAVARKIEFIVRQGDLDADIQVRPIILTAEQCAHYNLPRTPIKETERRAAFFESRHGEGATELDALEALHPGELEKILTREILRYYDPTLAERTAEAADAVEEHLEDITDTVIATYQDQLDALDDEKQALEALVREWEAKAAPVWSAISTDLVLAANELDEPEWPEPAPCDDDPDPLFDGRRGYIEQMDRYKRHQGKPTEARMPPNSAGSREERRNRCVVALRDNPNGTVRNIAKLASVAPSFVVAMRRELAAGSVSDSVVACHRTSETPENE